MAVSKSTATQHHGQHSPLKQTWPPWGTAASACMRLLYSSLPPVHLSLSSFFKCSSLTSMTETGTPLFLCTSLHSLTNIVPMLEKYLK